MGGGASAWRSGRAKRGPAMRLPARLDRLQRRLARAWHERAVTLKAASFAMVGVVNTLVDNTGSFSPYTLINRRLIPPIVLPCPLPEPAPSDRNCFFPFAATPD